MSKARNISQLLMPSGDVKTVHLDEAINIQSSILSGITTITQAEDIGRIISVPSYSRVGEVVVTTGSAVFGDCLKADGTLYLRAEAPKLWEFAQSCGNLVTDTVWNDNMKFAYSSGDGVSTFRVPDYRGEFLRGFDDGAGIDVGRTLGSGQEDTVKTHNHGLGGVWKAYFAAGTNRWGLYMSGDAADAVAQPKNKYVDRAGGSETRPTNGAVIYCIKYI